MARFVVPGGGGVTRVTVGGLALRARPVRPSNPRFTPSRRQFQHATNRTAVGFVNKYGMPEKILRVTATKHIDNQTTVGFNGTYLVADFVHMCDEENSWRLSTGWRIAQMQNQISSFISHRSWLGMGLGAPACS